jgi:hypothetical protein
MPKYVTPSQQASVTIERVADDLHAHKANGQMNQSAAIQRIRTGQLVFFGSSLMPSFSNNGIMQ